MEGAYSKIFKQAYYLTKSYRSFWLAGLFLIWPTLFKIFFVTLAFVPSFNNSPGSGGSSASYQTGDMWVGIISLTAIFLVSLMYFKSKAALIMGVNKLRDSSILETKKVIAESDIYAWPLLKLGVTLALLILFVTAFLLSPVLYLNSENYSSRAATLGFLALIIYMPIICYLYYSSIFAPALMVAQRVSIKNSLRICLDIIFRYWPTLVIFTLILLGIEILSILLSAVLAGIAAVPFVLIIRMFYDNGGQGLETALQALGGTAAFVVFFMSQAVAVAFQKIAWTIMFFEISKPVKAPESPETAPVPEIVSGT